MQEICADIILPEKFTIPGIKFKRQVLQLEGQLYPQDLVQARFAYFTLTLGPIPGFVLSQLPPELQKQSWQCISIGYDDEQVPPEVASSRELYSKDSFFDLLQLITLNAAEWILVFTTECNEPGQALAGDWKAAREKIRESLELNNGFMMYNGATGAPLI